MSLTAQLSKEELNKAILSTKLAIANAIDERDRVYEQNKLYFFKPFPKQLSFLRNADAKRRVVFAGNRFGKTFLGSAEDCSWALGYRPFFPEGHPLRYFGIPEHGVRILLIVEDWDKAEELYTGDGSKGKTKGYLFNLLPEMNIESVSRNQRGVVDAIFVESMVHGFKRRSSIHVDTVSSYMRNAMSQESSHWDAIHVDEPIPQGMWNATSRGLVDRNGSAWWLLTPLKHPWMYNMATDAEKAGDKNWHVIHGSMDDNPTLTEEAKELYFANLTGVEADCRRRGIPLSKGNLVLSSFDENRHIWPAAELGNTPAGWADPYTPPRDYTIAVAIDTHPQTPTAVLFAAVAPTGQIFFFREYWVADAENRISATAKMILEPRFKLSYVLLEPAAFLEDPETRRSFADIFEEHGMEVQRGSKQRTYAIQQTNALFGSNRKVFFMPHMKRSLNELRTWYFDKADKPLDKDDHFMECLGRLVLYDELKYHRPTSDERSAPPPSATYDDTVINFLTA